MAPLPESLNGLPSSSLKPSRSAGSAFLPPSDQVNLTGPRLPSMAGNSKLMIDHAGIAQAVVTAGRGLDRGRVEQVARGERHVDRMARHVTQGAAAELPPATPFERLIVRRVGLHLRRTDPAIPVERLRAFAQFRSEVTLGPYRTVTPDVDLFRFAENAGLNHGRGTTEAVACRTLVAHHRLNLHLLRRFRNQTRFVDGPCQRFLAEAVLAHPHRH